MSDREMYKWRVVIDDGHGFPHAYEVRASDRLSAHTFFMCIQAGLRLFGVSATTKDKACYLGTTDPIVFSRMVKQQMEYAVREELARQKQQQKKHPPHPRSGT